MYEISLFYSKMTRNAGIINLSSLITYASPTFIPFSTQALTNRAILWPDRKLHHLSPYVNVHDARSSFRTIVFKAPVCTLSLFQAIRLICTSVGQDERHIKNSFFVPHDVKFGSNTGAPIGKFSHVSMYACSIGSLTSHLACLTVKLRFEVLSTIL